MQTKQSRWLLLFAVLLVLYKAYYVLYPSIQQIFEAPSIKFMHEWGITDYLFNYQGGFLRRGLIGEILLFVSTYSYIPLHSAIIGVGVLSFLFSIGILFHIYKKMKLIPILPLFVLMPIVGYRRDFFVIFISYWIYNALFCFIRSLKIWPLVIFVTLTCATIIIYEPSFFFIYPISILILYNARDKMGSYRLRLKNGLLLLAPIFCMAIVCAAKGSAETAVVVWNSWNHIYKPYGLESVPNFIPDALSFMSNSTMDAFMYHLRMNFGIACGCTLGFNPFLLAGFVFFIFGFYYLITMIPSVSIRNATDRILIGNICAFQFFCLIPMFTVLSCDYGRTINYVIYSSYYLYYLLKINRIDLLIPCINSVSKKSQEIILSNRILSSLWFYILFMFLVPFSMYNGASILTPLALSFLCLV